MRFVICVTSKKSAPRVDQWSSACTGSSSVSTTFTCGGAFIEIEQRAYEERAPIAELGQPHDLEHALAGATLNFGLARSITEAHRSVALHRDIGGRERRDVRTSLAEERAKRAGREDAIRREVGCEEHVAEAIVARAKLRPTRENEAVARELHAHARLSQIDREARLVLLAHGIDGARDDGRARRDRGRVGQTQDDVDRVARELFPEPFGLDRDVAAHGRGRRSAFGRQPRGQKRRRNGCGLGARLRARLRGVRRVLRCLGLARCRDERQNEEDRARVHRRKSAMTRTLASSGGAPGRCCVSTKTDVGIGKVLAEDTLQLPGSLSNDRDDLSDARERRGLACA